MAGYSIGENYVLDNSGSLRTLQAGLQQRQAERIATQKQREKENQDLMDQMGKLTPKGLSTQDLPKFNEKVEKLKEQYYKYRAAKDPTEMRAAKMEVDNAWRDAFNYTEIVSTNRKRLVEVAKHFAAHREDYNDDAIKAVTSEIQKPGDEVDFSKVEPLAYERKVDEVKLMDRVQKDLKGLIDGSVAETKIVNVPGAKGQKSRSIIQNAKEVAEDGINKLIDSYSSEDDFKKMLKNRYGAIPFEQQVAAFKKDIPKEWYTKFEKPQVQTNQPIIVKTGGSKADSATEQARLYDQDQIRGLLDGDSKAIERLSGVLNGTGKVAPTTLKEKNGNLNIRKDGDKLIIDIPRLKNDKLGEKEYIPAERHVVMTNTERGIQQVAAIYQRLTGTKISPAVINTLKGKKVVSKKAPAVNLGKGNTVPAKSKTTTSKKNDPLGLGI